MTSANSTDDAQDQDATPVQKLDDGAIHIFAHCMWWVNRGDELPKDPAQRDMLWRDECYAWVAETRQLLLHLEYNGLAVIRK